MTRQTAHLPEYYPIGTRYVIEGKNDPAGALKVSSRYVVFPDGRRIDLPLQAGTAQLTRRQLLTRPSRRRDQRKRPRPEQRLGA
jgi:hypothetical protein